MVTIHKRGFSISKERINRKTTSCNYSHGDAGSLPDNITTLVNANNVTSQAGAERHHLAVITRGLLSIDSFFEILDPLLRIATISQV